MYLYISGHSSPTEKKNNNPTAGDFFVRMIGRLISPLLVFVQNRGSRIEKASIEKASIEKPAIKKTGSTKTQTGSAFDTTGRGCIRGQHQPSRCPVWTKGALLVFSMNGRRIRSEHLRYRQCIRTETVLFPFQPGRSLRGRARIYKKCTSCQTPNHPYAPPTPPVPLPPRAPDGSRNKLPRFLLCVG